MSGERRAPQPTDKVIQRLRRHARVLRRAAAEPDAEPPHPAALRAMANVNDQAAGRLEDFLRAHGSDVMPALAATKGGE